ncbi:MULTISPECIES: hypothetical protein [Streptomyces]|uniref:Integral membrane protein n=1 Tax=Streptomyces doudnae TaxID=3075536 RepID=A0ABD5EXW3_9ACTN|nr:MULTISPECIES: hypothetical protein [unclassified Streptomyces]MDT0439601.1 hypothetical protein [Streptomyces sp. DSM 41981]MYQ65633.1 hypothetical protein [Streptomyces sp. SID4950]SCE04268.1 hypothetical protein GA0115242_120514 [Streptomyces sp. SolWspMP-5a-2]
MNLRVLRIELRRSAAPWAGLVVAAVGLGFLYAVPGAWWGSSVQWTSQWTSLALWTRVLFFYLWPLVAGIGALYGLRDRRSRMPELLASAPRPAWRRAAAPAGAAALALTAGFGLLVLWGAVQVASGPATYAPLGWLPISAVGLLALLAALLFGMGTGRALPSPLTPPAVVVVFLAATVLLAQNNERELPTSTTVPHLLSQLSPAVAEPRQVLLTLTGAVHLGQAFWFLGLAATGFVLLTAVRARQRLTALVPAVAGLALALLVLPGTPRGSYRIDPAAASPVCEGAVCVTAMHRDRLAGLAPDGARALKALRSKLGDRAPRRVREETAPRALGADRVLDPATVLVNFEDPQFGSARGDQLLRRLIGEGLAPSCSANTAWEGASDGSLLVQSVLASWVLGEYRLIGTDSYDPAEYRDSTRRAWDRFAALEPAEQLRRAVTVRTAALRCDLGPADKLVGEPR